MRALSRDVREKISDSSGCRGEERHRWFCCYYYGLIFMGDGSVLVCIIVCLLPLLFWSTISYILYHRPAGDKRQLKAQDVTAKLVRFDILRKVPKNILFCIKLT